MCYAAVIPLALAAVGGLKQASAQRQAGQVQNQIADQNAAVAKSQEQQAYEVGASKIDQYSRQLKVLQGRAEAAAAGDGIVSNRGSPLDLMVQSERFGETDIQQIRNNAQMEAFGYATRAANFTNQGALDLYEGNQASQSTLLTTAGDMYSDYYRLTPPKAGSGAGAGTT